MKGEFTIVPVDPQQSEVAALLKQADDYLLARYPPDICYLDDVTILAKPEVTLLGAFMGGTLVGMGALKRRHADGPYGEIKRVFVAGEQRGQGIGRGLMLALEGLARREGLPVLRLETGTEQPEAVALYEMLGYRPRGPFADYADESMSIFMEKHLTKAENC